MPRCGRTVSILCGSAIKTLVCADTRTHKKTEIFSRGPSCVLLPRCQLGGGRINIWRHLAGNVFKRNRQTLKCASFLLFMPIGVISATCVYFLEYLEGSYAFFLSIVPYILNEGSLFFCKYVFMFILYPLYTVYNKTCQLQRCLSKNESMSELFAIPFCLEINCHCENLLTVRAKPIIILLSHFTGCWAAGAHTTFARGIYMDILLDEEKKLCF